MTSHNLMNFNLDAYRCKRSDAKSRSMWQLNNIISIIYIIYTQNFYTDEKPKISSIQLYAACKDFQPWQVQHEINIEIGITFFALIICFWQLYMYSLWRLSAPLLVCHRKFIYIKLDLIVNHMRLSS